MATIQFIRTLVSEYGSKEISSAIGQLRRRLDTMQPVLEDIGQIYVEAAKYRIDTQTDPQGHVWKHNSPTTQMYKKTGMTQGYLRCSRGPAIKGANFRLVWTGDLKDNIQYRVAGNTVIVLSNVPYATTQQFGALKGKFRKITKKVGTDKFLRYNIPWGEIPKRPFLGTNKKTTEAVAAKLGEYLLGNLVAKQLGFRS